MYYRFICLVYMYLFNTVETKSNTKEAIFTAKMGSLEQQPVCPSSNNTGPGVFHENYNKLGIKYLNNPSDTIQLNLPIIVHPFQSPERPQTTRDKEKVNITAVAAQPTCTMAGSPSAITIASWAAWAAGVAATAVKRDRAAVPIATFCNKKIKYPSTSILCQHTRLWDSDLAD
jgi:hypothetical protein